jgi:ABC-2 type transport system ATP-binding protein
MRQRLGLAQALVNKPEVLLLDEPASALDPTGRREVLQLITDLRESCTVFMSTHILADVERVCDTVGIVAAGKLVVMARQDELLERFALPAFELETDDGDAPLLGEWCNQVARQSWVTAITVDNNRARITVNDVAAGKKGILASALAAGLAPIRFELVRPSLEDIFLRLVGQPEV